MRILVTGATGFVGRAVVRRLAADGDEVLAASRTVPDELPAGVRPLRFGELAEPQPDLPIDRVDVVIHAAARVHVMKETAADSMSAFRRVNVDGSIAVATRARAAGAVRFVFLSSIKVLGEVTRERPFRANDLPAPQDPYGRSKLEAEQALAAFASATGMELVVIRPPLVYGPGVGANFRQLMAAVASGWPLPFGLIEDNRRSLVAIDNLVDLIARSTRHAGAVGQTLLVSDDEDLSTAELVRRMARSLGVSPRLVPVPVWALNLAGRAIGRSEAMRRLCESLRVDISATRGRLDWSPPVTVDAALAATAREFLRQRRT